MKLKNIFAFLVLNIFFVSGCATSRGFNRNSLREEIGQNKIVDDREIKKTLELKPQLPKPFKIGVYIQESNQRWHWNFSDREKLVSWASDLKKAKEVSEVFIINADLAKANDLKSIRYAAAQHGADAVVVVSGISDIDSYSSKWAWTYIALIPMLFVPGNEMDVIFLARAAMWDVKNQYLYLTAEAEGLRNEIIPFVSRNEKAMIESTKKDAITKLSEQLTISTKRFIEKQLQ